MFSCSHFSNFLSDPIRKQSAMSKGGQEATSSEGSPMAKPKPMIPAKARPINLVSHSPWSARENLPQLLRYLVNRVNVDEGQGSQNGTRKLVRTNQSPEVEYSQVRRQENALIAERNLCMEQLHKQSDQREHFISTCSGQLQGQSFKT